MDAEDSVKDDVVLKIKIGKGLIPNLQTYEQGHWLLTRLRLDPVESKKKLKYFKDAADASNA